MSAWDAIAASLGPGAYGMSYPPSSRMDRWAEQTDDTLITVPVLDTTAPPRQQALSDQTKERGVGGYVRRKALGFDNLSNAKVNVTLRHVPRREYQKHYIRDDHGRYIGTEAPAEDCILNAEDTARWRGGATKEDLVDNAGSIEKGTLKDDVDIGFKSFRYSENADLPPRPVATSKGRFGLFKSNKRDHKSNGVEIIR